MHRRGAHAHKPDPATIASTGLCLAWLFGSTICIADTAWGDSIAPRAASGQNRVCNPAPEATAEDAKLAAAVLRDTTQIEHWRNVAWYLGELAFSECYDLLRDFVWETHGHSDTSHYMLDAITSAQASIGHVAASSPAALDYLIQSTNPAFWRSLPWRDSRRTEREMRLEMSKASIKGLGLSGAPEAGQMLARLRQWPFAESQRATVEDAFRRFRNVSRLRKYSPADLRPLSRYHLSELLPATEDSSLLYGTWRWMRSSSGGGYSAPPICGWSRTLVLEPDSTYSFWEEDSADAYPICSGRFTVHATSKGLWIELENWSWVGPGTYWPMLRGPDLLALRPGGSRGVWHSLGSSHIFAREPATVPPVERNSAKVWRSPRVRRSSRASYFIEVPRPLRGLSASAESRRWSSYSKLGPKNYEYTHYQIPSGVIGDFDGDSLADVAILGYDDDYRNVVSCLLSNRGSPRAAVAWTERGSGRKDQPTLPLHYLKLFASGGSYVDSRGNRTDLPTDAIWVVGKDGESTILYHGNGVFHQAHLSTSRDE
jgi:hypothetical protein